MLSGKERRLFSLVLCFLFIQHMTCFSPLFSSLLGFSFCFFFFSAPGWYGSMPGGSVWSAHTILRQVLWVTALFSRQRTKMAFLKRCVQRYRKNVKQSGDIKSIEVLPCVLELFFSKTEPIKYLHVKHKNLFKLEGYYKHLISNENGCWWCVMEFLWKCV